MCYVSRVSRCMQYTHSFLLRVQFIKMALYCPAVWVGHVCETHRCQVAM